MKLYLKILIPFLIILVVALAFFWNSKKTYFFQTKTPQLAQISDNGDDLQSIYQTAQQLTAQNTKNSTATFLAVGDIMLSRDVGKLIQTQNNPDLPFLSIADELKSTDFNFANLESPVAAGLPVIGGTSLIFGANSSSLSSLKDFNFQVINLANNHAFDQGLDGVDITRLTLDKLGIEHEGTGDNLDQAWQPAVVSANGIKLCFIGASFSSVNDGGKTTNSYVARIEDAGRLKTAIASAKTECDFTVVTVHAGIEYTKTPNTAQTTFAHSAIDDGADVVIGAHPHWVQTIEKYKGKYIFYSLGNFVFDQGWSKQTMEGLTLKIQISKKLISNVATTGAATLDDLQGQRLQASLDSIELLPVIIQNSQPRPATAQETKNILDEIGEKDSVIYP